MNIDAVNNNAALVQEVSARIPTRTLNQEDFLQLVVAQMSHQDPMNPKTDTDFIAQMAQFSALEQSKSMQSDIALLRNEQQVLQANTLIGREVTLVDEQGALVNGPVSAVQVKEGTPSIVVNGKAYGLSALLSIQPPADTTQR
jgi:flagellar basal-body rod modification protein FlgD